MEIFDNLIVHPLLNVLVAVFHALSYFNIPYSLGFAIIGLTIIIRIVLYPLTGQQLKASKKMQDIAPHLSGVKEKHKGDRARIQQETMKLYKEHGVNPAAGCLPTLLQLPIIFGLYSVLNNVVHKAPNELVAYINGIVIDPLMISVPWDSMFFGLALGQSPSQLMSSVGPIVLLVPLLTGAFQFFQSKMLFPTNKNKDKKKSDDFATAFQSQATYIFPLMIGFFSFTLPVGLSLYWNTFTIFGIMQQYRIMGLGGAEELWQKIRRQ